MLKQRKWGIDIPLHKFDNISIQNLIDFCIENNFNDRRLFILLDEKLTRMEC